MQQLEKKHWVGLRKRKVELVKQVDNPKSGWWWESSTEGCAPCTLLHSWLEVCAARSGRESSVYGS